MTRSTSRPLHGVVIGAGDRGYGAYAPYLLGRPQQGRFVAVADPSERRRRAFARRYGLAPDAQFETAEDLLEGPPRGDFAIIATPDAQHLEPALRAMERGYHVLLEKPMALREDDCRQLVAAAERSGVVLQICHVLRYSPLFERLARVVHGGEIGDVVAIQHSENVSHWHYAHSYCRGNWRNRAASSPMILAKSCHDLDLLYWYAGAAPARLTSFARPTELTERNAPPGAPEYCIEGCPHASQCPYDATVMYRDLGPLLDDAALTEHPRYAPWLVAAFRRHRPLLDRLRWSKLRGLAPWTGWPLSVIGPDPSPQGVDHALRTSRYGRCVYRVGDNDQVSAQTVQVQFRNGVTASFTMHGSSYREGREIRIDGTRGSAVGRFYQLEARLDVTEHRGGPRRRVRVPLSLGGHGGADHRLFAGFLAAVRGEAKPLTTAAESLTSHQMAFAADRAEREGRVIQFPDA
jgi:predicted dehydrogenase